MAAAAAEAGKLNHRVGGSPSPSSELAGIILSFMSAGDFSGLTEYECVSFVLFCFVFAVC